MLEIRELDTGYGKKQVIFGLSLEVERGEIVALIGPNGSGKSTVLRAAYGLIPVWKGELRFGGEVIKGSTPVQNVVRGITFSPQGSRVFAHLTVMENLEIGGFRFNRSELNSRIEQILQLFPVLKARARQESGKLSGGEQQMLALGRALIPKPKLLMLDEPSLGLAPNLAKDVFEKIVEINHEINTSILIVEQKVRDVLEICKSVYSIRLGKIAFKGSPEELKQNKHKLKELFL
ncbi:ABC transporter ATP-binding protein [Acidobacteriota bacterium]